jgi:undecaprenyl-diphosphatase
MGIDDAMILAILQGITEFLPISSSGHLVLAQRLLGLDNVPVLYNLILHLGTLCATIIVFNRIIVDIFWDLCRSIFKNKEERKRIYERGNIKLALYIILSTAVTGTAGFIFRDRLKEFFFQPLYVIIFLLLTGFLLLFTKFIPRKQKEIGDLGLIAPFLIGCSQAVSMLPGISRSGSTISTGLFTGMSRSLAGTYSFLLSIPSILGASLFEFAHAGESLRTISSGVESGPVYLLVLTGFILSMLTGYLALRVLLSFLKRGQLHIFSYYCFVIAISGFILIYLVQ